MSALEKAGLAPKRLPFSLKILLENLLRTRGRPVGARRRTSRALASWDPKAEPSQEIAFTPARVLLQDFTGVPAVVDLAAMRDAMKTHGRRPQASTRCSPPSWSSTTRCRSTSSAAARRFRINAELEFQRNHERYAFLRWGQKAFHNFKVVPPDTGIVHQVNLEYLARVVFTDETADGRRVPIPTRWSAPIRTPR